VSLRARCGFLSSWLLGAGIYGLIGKAAGQAGNAEPDKGEEGEHHALRDEEASRIAGRR